MNEMYFGAFAGGLQPLVCTGGARYGELCRWFESGISRWQRGWHGLCV